MRAKFSDQWWRSAENRKKEPARMVGDIANNGLLWTLPRRFVFSDCASGKVSWLRRRVSQSGS
ncbi:MAG: hypothetical protein ACRENG_16670, partial [bacterium]